MWCFHDRLRQFTFSNGVEIKCCPDCTGFDTKRNEVLRSGSLEIPTSQLQIHWEFLLTTAGFGFRNGLEFGFINGGDIPRLLKLMFASSPYLEVADIEGNLELIANPFRPPQPPRMTMIDDHEHIERARPFPHTLTMPRAHRAFCVHCIEVVLSTTRPWIIRFTKGVYLPVEHECHSVRVYDLHGTLLEVKGQ